MQATEQVTGSDEKATGLEWAQKYQRHLAAGGIAVLAVAVGAWFLVASGKRKEAFAMAELERARDAADAGNLPLAASGLQQVVNTYGGTDAALEATLTLNVVRIASGQHQLAADDLARFVGTNPPARFAAQAHVLHGVALENLGQHAEAAQAYEQASQTADMDFAKAEALLGAARAHRNAGNMEGAATALRTILDQYGETPSAAEAQVRLGEVTQGKS